MNLSDIYYQQFAFACRSKKPQPVINRLWHRWQDALIAENKPHVKGKKVAILAW